MGFERMNNGRCPPFILGGCILLCIVLICNWWSLSTQNYELLRQIDEISKSMKICSEDRNQCTDELTGLNKNFGDLKVQADQQKSFHDNLIQKQDNDLTMCKTLLESLKNLDASHNMTLSSLRSDLNKKKEDIEILNDKLQTAQKKLKDLLNKGTEKEIKDDVNGQINNDAENQAVTDGDTAAEVSAESRKM